MAMTGSTGEVRAFKVVSVVEAVTFLVLLGCVVLKRVLDGPDLVSVMGPIHGVAFLLYLVLVLRIREGQGWALGRTLMIVIAAALPFGGFWAERQASPASSTAA